MNVLIFTIGSVIFITYMYFLLRMVNRAHKAQEKAQGKYNYKRQNHVTRKRGSISADDCERIIKNAKDYISAHEKRKIKDRWDS